MEPTDASKDADSAAVAELLAVFDDNNSRLTREGMALSDLLAMHHTVGDLEECVKGVQSWVVQGDFDDLWAKAYSAGVVASARTLTLRGLFRFRDWLMSPNGQASLRAFQHEQKQKEQKKLALLRLFTAQKEDRLELISAGQAECDRKVARLQRKIEKAKKAQEEAVANAREEYPVSSGYVAPDAAFVRERCWDMYYAAEGEGEGEGRRRMPSAREVEDKYVQVVRDRHLLAYLRRPEVKEALLAYGRDKLLTLRDQGSRLAFTEFHGILEIASGGSVSLPDVITTPARGEDSEGNRKRKH